MGRMTIKMAIITDWIASMELYLMDLQTKAGKGCRVTTHPLHKN
ncbi:hypothetical protein N9I19_20305 [Peribacillus sp. CSMR9]|nr:hypothetical protein [Peribacillus sp. CSMR9]